MYCEENTKSIKTVNMNLKMLKLMLDTDPRLTSEVKEQLIENSTEIFNFNDHLKATLEINDDEAEKLVKSFIEARAKTGSLEEFHTIFFELGESYKFENPDKLAVSMINILKLVLEDGGA
jgi:protein subunit release factor A